jgi:hypothetical protein
MPDLIAEGGLDGLIEARGYWGPGYRPVVDYGSWRVALLNGSEQYEPRNIAYFQRHDETDEVFVLLEGSCLLFAVDGRLGPDGRVDPESVRAVDMEMLRVYNVKRGVYHSHALSDGASVLVVENADTSRSNSPIAAADDAVRERLVELARGLLVAGG